MFFLGFDLGTSYFKAGVFDVSGELKGLGRVATPVVSNPDGIAEMEVPLFWQALRTAFDEALAQAGATGREIAGVSYSSQANTFLLLDEKDVPLTPLILWTDRRAEPVAPWITTFGASEAFHRTAGMDGLGAGFAVSKWNWLRENESALWQRTRRLMTLSDYFTYTLTGEYVGDAGTAAFLGLLDVGRRRWWPEALCALGIEKENLSIPLPPGTVVGRTRASAADFLGLPAGVPFAVGGLDHQVAALGSGLGRFAEVSISTGTVLAAMTLVNKVEPHPGCYHGPHFGEGVLYRLAFNPNGAGQLEAYQRAHAPDLTLDELAALAEAATPGVLSLDLTRHEGTGDFSHGAAIRYLMEEISVSHRRLLRLIAGSTPVKKIVATGGGTRSALWLQIKADILALPVVTPATPERACLGAAMLASVAAGAYRSITEAADGMFKPGCEYHPDPKRGAFYRARFPESIDR